MSFVNSVLMGSGNAITYQIVDTVSQYADTMKPLTTMVSNGEIIMISAGLLLIGAAYYAYNRGMNVVAAFGVELGPLLLISGVLDIFKRKASLSQIARVRRVPPAAPPVASPQLFTSQN